MGQNSEPETNMQDTTPYKLTLPQDGLKILARLIVRHRERESKQLKPVDSMKEGASYDEWKNTNG